MVSGQSKLHCPGSGKGPGLTPARTEDNSIKGVGYRVALRTTSDAPAPMKARDPNSRARRSRLRFGGDRLLGCLRGPAHDADPGRSARARIVTRLPGVITVARWPQERRRSREIGSRAETWRQSSRPDTRVNVSATGLEIRNTV